MARIALPDGDSPEIVRALSLRPEFAKAVGGFDAVVWGSGLDWRLHELVRMQVAIINECTVCLGWRTPQAIDAGVTDELLAGVASYQTFPDFTETERVALEYTEHFCTDSARIDDELVDRLRARLADDEIVELTLVFGKYLSMGRFMQVLGLDQACSLQFDDAGRITAS
ncbi:MAG: carboxymuconolactone decarboxylase family protein [Acidimicrobiia bacterium]